MKESDLVGGWRIQQAQFGYDLGGQGMALAGRTRAWLVLWSDHLWIFGGPVLGHGGARWRLVGDTLWLTDDYRGYYHGVLEGRVLTLIDKERGIGVVDEDVVRRVRPNGLSNPFSAAGIPDSVYWSPAFRDTTRFCEAGGICTTLVYKVTRNKDGTLSLVNLAPLTRASGGGVAATLRLKRDTLSMERCFRMLGTTPSTPAPSQDPPGWLRRAQINFAAWAGMHDDSCR